MYSKHFIALESDPEIFSELLHLLGVAESLRFRDLLSLDTLEGQYLPSAPLALIVIYPDTDKTSVPGTARFKDCKSKDVVWTEQKINNACGLYAILHAALNGPTRAYVREYTSVKHLSSPKYLIGPDSTVQRLLDRGGDDDRDISSMIYDSEEIREVYEMVADKGSTEPPADPSEEVTHHYVCFTRATKSSLWLLDGDRDGPLVSEVAGADDVGLDDRDLELIRDFVRECDGNETGRSAVMALVKE